MKIRHYFNLKNNTKINIQILELLKKCDHEFFPPLSKRASTVQVDLKTNQGNDINFYFNELIKQDFLIAFDDDNLVMGFMSFKTHYISKDISSEYENNIYVSTIIVDPNNRGGRITRKFYEKCKQLFPDRYIITRTWSLNVYHIAVLTSLNFREFLRLKNDRGVNEEGEFVDTVYYMLDPRKKSVKEVIYHNHLWGNVFFLLLLSVLTAVFFVLNVLAKNEMVISIASAIATSLLASLLCLVCDTTIRYKDAQRDEYMNNLKSFGISNLRFEKGVLLEGLIRKAKDEIWISGYRLVMTSKNTFLESLEVALNSKYPVSVKVLLVPPFSETYVHVYGRESVYENYEKVFNLLFKYYDGRNDRKIEIHVTDNPLFNDTYKVDRRVVTSPYLHCKDNDGKKLTAKDFFTIDITDEGSKLYQLISDEYLSVWEENTTKIFDLKGYMEKEKNENNWFDIFKENLKENVKENDIKNKFERVIKGIS